MAIRFGLAVSSGLAFGSGASWLNNKVEARSDHYLPEGTASNRAAYGKSDDDTSLDIKHELEEARRLQREYDDHHGHLKSKGAIGFKFRPLKLGEVINLTEEQAIFRFLLPNIDDEFVMEPCSTLQLQKKDGAMRIEQVQRMYTPITPGGTKGYFDILVKKMPQGRMTEHLWSMKVGESMNFRLVMHKLKYLPNVYENVGMIGTGTGITPLLQVIRASVADAADKTKLTLLFANPTDQRVLLKGTLDELAELSKGRFKPFYTVDRTVSNEPWQGFIGLIDGGMIKRTMPPPGKRNIILVCGSDQLINNLCGVPLNVLKPWSAGRAIQPAAGHGAGNFGDDLGGVLGDLGYQSEHVYRF